MRYDCFEELRIGAHHLPVNIEDCRTGGIADMDGKDSSVKARLY